MSQAAQNYHVFETAMGFCAIAWSDAGVVRFQLPTKSAEAAERLMRRRAVGAEPAAPPEDVAAVVAAAKRYFDGEETDFSHVRLDLGGEDRILHPDLRRPAPGRLGPHDHLRRAGEGGRRGPRGGARRRRGDGQKSGAARSFPVTGFWPPAARSAVSRRPAVRGRRSACSNWRAFASDRRKQRSNLSVSERNTARDPSVPLWRIAGARSCLRLAPFELRKPGVVAIKRDPGTRARLQERRTMRRRRAAH